MTFLNTQAEQVRIELANLTLDLTPGEEIQALMLELEMIDAALDDVEAGDA
jgi:hypothetical protein